MVKYLERIKQPSLRWGLVFGVILGVVDALYNFATSYVSDQNAQQILSYVPAVLFLVLGFYAGLRASQLTGKWTTGLVAGLWTGLIGTVIADLIPLIYTLINIQSIVASTQAYIKTHEAQTNNMKPSDYTSSDVMVAALIELLVLAVNTAFFTIVGGGLGAFVGRRRALAVGAVGSAASSPTYEEAMFEAPAEPDAVSIEADNTKTE